MKGGHQTLGMIVVLKAICSLKVRIVNSNVKTRDS